jgi:hypothetical protein
VMGRDSFKWFLFLFALVVVICAVCLTGCLVPIRPELPLFK